MSRIQRTRDPLFVSSPEFPNGKWPFFSAEERAVADQVLASGQVNYWSGGEGRQFEQEFATFHDRRYGVSLCSGSVALDIALTLLELNPADEVLIPARNYVAAASSVVRAGAKPIFIDVDGDSGNCSAETIAAGIGKTTKAVVVTHLAGWPCDMQAISKVADENGLAIIEDCSQAHGAKISNKYVGSFGRLACFSFCQDKIISTGGEGGMLLLDDEKHWRAAWSLKDNGKSPQAALEETQGTGFRWLIESFGSNWRLTEMQSAIGRIQLRKLDEWVAIRTRNARRLAEVLARHRCARVPMPPANYRHAYYKLYAYVRPELLKPGWSRDRILAGFEEQGLPGLSGSCSEIYLEKAFKDAGLQPTDRLPVAKELGETSMMFQVHPTLTESDLAYTCDVIDSVLSQACA